MATHLRRLRNPTTHCLGIRGLIADAMNGVTGCLVHRQKCSIVDKHSSMRCVRACLCVRRQRHQQLQYEAGVIQSRGDLCYSSAAAVNDVTGKLLDDRCQDAMSGGKQSTIDYVVNTSTAARLQPSHQRQLSSSDSVCLSQTLRRYVDHMYESSHFPTT